MHRHTFGVWQLLFETLHVEAWLSLISAACRTQEFRRRKKGNGREESRARGVGKKSLQGIVRARTNRRRSKQATHHLVKNALVHPPLSQPTRVELLIVPFETLPVLLVQLSAVLAHARHTARHVEDITAKQGEEMSDGVMRLRREKERGDGN